MNTPTIKKNRQIDLKNNLSAFSVGGLPCLLLMLLAPSFGYAQWTGDGAGGAVSETDINNSSYWTGGDINGDFTGNSSNATLTLSEPTTTFGGLNFNWATANDLVINGNGTGANEIIEINGDILLSRASGTSSVTIGSDVTLDYGTFTTERLIQYGDAGAGGSTVLYIDGLITGTAGSGGSLYFAYNTSNPVIYLRNDGNTFDAPINSNTNLYFTSISDVGGGASSLGAATTVANGTITTGGKLIFIGSADQSSDRNIGLNYNASISNYSETGASLTLYGTINKKNRYLDLEASSGNVLDISGTIYGSSNSVRIGQVSGDTGTVRLSGMDNNYTGGTSVLRGTLEVTKLADGGMNSSIGASSNSASNLVIRGDLGAKLRYVGSTDSSTDRLFTIGNNSTIESSGTGRLSFTNAGNIEFIGSNSSTKLILSGSNTGANTLNLSLTDNGTGPSSLDKNGAGTWVLGGTNTYTGATSVNGGILHINGSLTGSAVTVFSGGTLGGNGTITPGAGHSLVVQSGGILAPGNTSSADTLTVALNNTGDSASFLSGASFNFDLIAPGDSDMVSFTGLTQNVASITYSDNVINFIAAGGMETGEYTLFTFDADNAYTGTLTIGTGLEGYAGSYLTYSADTIMLTLVPEPGSVAMFTGMFGLIAAVFIRRRRVTA